MLTKQIAKTLKNAIARGEYRSGQRLVEASLCKHYSVGRTRIREALRDLEHEGFVRIIPNAGAVVTEISEKDVEQIYDLMGVLEGLAMRVATSIIKTDEIKKIEKLVRKMEETSNAFRFYQVNFEFHTLMGSLSGNTRLIKYMENLRAQAKRISLQSFYNPSQINASVREHRNILEAIKEINPPKVEKLIRDHYLTGKRRIIKYMNRSL